MARVVSPGVLQYSEVVPMTFPIDLPQQSLDLAAELRLNPDDVTEHFIRGTGKGGQKKNKTSSMVQLVHLPTGIEVRVQRYREQHLNRLAAWKLLIQKLEDQVKGKESTRAKAMFKLKKQKQRRSRKAKEKMLDQKHRRSELKEARKPLY